jgi:hypothetical protein
VHGDVLGTGDDSLCHLPRGTDVEEPHPLALGDAPVQGLGIDLFDQAQALSSDQVFQYITIFLRSAQTEAG